MRDSNCIETAALGGCSGVFVRRPTAESVECMSGDSCGPNAINLKNVRASYFRSRPDLELPL